MMKKYGPYEDPTDAEFNLLDVDSEGFVKIHKPQGARLLFTDTDSLCYEIYTEDVYKDFYEDKDLFDNSDYSPDSEFYFDNNKKSHRQI